MTKLPPMVEINTLGPAVGIDEPHNIALGLAGPRGGMTFEYITKDEALALIEKLKEATK